MTHTRNFTIQARTHEKAPELDGAIQGTIEGKIAEFIQENDTIRYAVQSNDSQENAMIEMEAIINNETRRLLTEAHTENPAEVQDFSRNPGKIEEIATNALTMAQKFYEAEQNLESSTLS